MLDFPASPTNGQTFNAPNGVSYQWVATPGIWSTISASLGTTGSGAVVLQTSPALLGNPTSVTPLVGDNDTSIATTAFVQSAIKTFTPRTYGAVGNGTTDDRAALQACIDACAAAGGGHVDLSGGRYLIDSGDLIMKSNVFLVGPWLTAGYATVQRNYSTTKGSIVLNSLYTIKFDDYDTYYLPYSSGLYGVTILRKGLGYPTNLRQAYDEAQAFAGTAITVSGDFDTSDVWLSNLLIIGFDWGIWFGKGSRSRIHYINADCTNGIHINNSADIQHMSNCHLWSFATAHVGAPVSYEVTGVANAAGKIRLTVEPLDNTAVSLKPNVLKTGDRITVAHPIGSNARGRWTITVITPYNPLVPATPVVFDLDGSTYAGPYTTGGNVWITATFREGIGFDLDTGCEWGEATDCFSWGQAIGFRLNDCYPGTLINCSADASGQTDNIDVIGFLVTGSQQRAASLIGCKSGGVGIGYKIDVTPDYNNTVALSDCRSWACSGTDYWIARGGASLVNCFGQTTASIVYVADAATSVTLIGGDFNDVQFTYESANSLRPTFLGVRGQGNVISGTSQVGATVNPLITEGSVLTLQSSNGVVGTGGMVMFGASQGPFAAIKGYVGTGGANPTGDLIFSTRRSAVDGTLLETFRVGGVSGTVYASGQVAANSLRTAVFNATSNPLPSVATAGGGARAIVTDATVSLTAGHGTAYVGGGANCCPVYTDGVVWRIG